MVKSDERYSSPEAAARAQDSRRRTRIARDRAISRLKAAHRDEFRLYYAQEAEKVGIKITAKSRARIEQAKEQPKVNITKAERAHRLAQRAEALEKIKAARAEVVAAEELVAEAVAEARMYGVKWDQIADLFPVSRSTVVRLYDPEAYNERNTPRQQAHRQAAANRG